MSYVPKPPKRRRVKPNRKSVSERVTIIMSAFRRPRKVEAQVASIRKKYPKIKILVGDNGDDFPNIPFYKLPFNCGLSATRNFLAARVRTPYLLLVDDDYIFTEDTDLEAFVDVLDSRPEVGVVGGSWKEAGEVICWNNRFLETSDTLHLISDNQTQVMFANQGTPYWITDTVHNFAMYRTEIMQSIQWEERLKLQEHYEYFYRLKKAGVTVAFTPNSSVIHDRHPRLPEYNAYRQDIEAFTNLAVRLVGKTQVSMQKMKRNSFVSKKPNIVILGEHTGTSTVARFLGNIGWNLGEAENDPWAEPTSLREEINCAPVFPKHKARQYMKHLEGPWVLKDPRFVRTYKNWLPLWEDHQPLLLVLVKPEEELRKSYARRGFEVNAQAILERYDKVIEKYPWQSLKLDFSLIAEALKGFDASRIGKGLRGDRDECD